MNKYTRELICFHDRWVIHGQRRKRCAVCGKTKTIRKRKRGRKVKRGSIFALKRYLSGKSTTVSSRYLCRARDTFNRNAAWPEIETLICPPYILMADALHIRTSKYRTFVHVMMILSPESGCAWLLPPHFDARGENLFTWQAAVDSIPRNILQNIKVLICDGKSGLLHIGRASGWLIQRCQFHLIARLQLKRSKYALSRHREEGVMLYELAKTVCMTTSKNELNESLSKLSLVAQSESNRYLKTIISGLVKNFIQYRTYLTHPKLNIPETTNPIESVNSLIRQLIRKMKGFENENSAREWIRALLKERKFVRLKRHRI